MFCKNCGTVIPPNSKFCTSCGTPATNAAPQLSVNSPFAQQQAPAQSSVNPQPMPASNSIYQSSPAAARAYPPASPANTTRGPGPGIASFILGLISVAICWIPIAGFLLPILPFALGIAGVVGRRRKKGFGICGIIFSCLSMLICLIISISLLVGSYAASS